MGLDPEPSRIPKHLRKKKNFLCNFLKDIVDETYDVVCAYKPNIAFYEMLGVDGIKTLEKIIKYIGDEVPVILDAKRGDVGHTASAYAKSIFETYKADATTVNPYLGYDSIRPFMDYQDKGIFILCLTSNAGSKDFQLLGDEPLYKQIAKQVSEWNIYKNLGLVVGATKPEELKEVRSVAPELPFLIPGIGAQGGDLKATVKNGLMKDGGGIIINVSRSVVYASEEDDYASAARKAAICYRDSIRECCPRKKN